ncbi:MAG: response regulator [Azoarcus sp.]|jgi:two-component system response regulator DctR|nr:response regulator [Azoarcus sp.]MDR1227781.1 response regulator [Azoarcus sp.]
MANRLAHIIDDDIDICDAISWQFRTRGIECRCWSSAEDFLSAWKPSWHGCIVLDIRLNGMSGLACFDILLANHCPLPVIFITGNGNIPIAVDTLKKGAFDFVEKPFNHNELADRVLDAFEFDDGRRRTIADRGMVEARLSALTLREREVMNLILEGHYNKVVADQLAISVRTVEAHRAQIFNKMKVRSAVELAQLMTALKG